MPKFLLIVFFLMANLCSSATDLKLTITFPQNIKTEKLTIILNDGGVSKLINPVLNNNSLVITEKIQSRLATIWINYLDDKNVNQGGQFIVNEKSVFLKFTPKSADHLFSTYESRDVFVLRNTRQYKELQKFAKDAITASAAASKEYDLHSNDSTSAARNRAYVNVALKSMEYIKLHGNDYWLFYHFYMHVAETLMATNKLEVYEVFNTAFPEEFRNSFEGQNLKKLIVGSIGLKTNDPVPAFTTKDIYGKEVSTAANKGKYMVICFWATWCSPCVAEIPFLKKLRNTYAEKDLEIISISEDRDSAAFFRGIKKYEMNWTHILPADDNLRRLFGNMPIPGLYLVDPEGLMKYSNWTDVDDRILEKTLADNLNAVPTKVTN